MKIWLWFVVIGIILFFIGAGASSYDVSYFMAPFFGLFFIVLGVVIGVDRLVRKAKYE